jgi:hypothetical protein
MRSTSAAGNDGSIATSAASSSARSVRGLSARRSRRRSTGSRPAAIASSSIADSRANSVVRNEGVETVALSFARCPGAPYCGHLARVVAFGRRLRGLPAARG